MQVQADVPAVLKELIETSVRVPDRPCWEDLLIAKFRKMERAEVGDTASEPILSGATPNTIAAFFRTLRNLLPADACVVADTGNHQVLTTRYFKSMVPRGLIIPTDFQSMGFGLPAAVGAKLAVGARRVIAIVGDGSTAMCGMELLTIAREKLPILVIVFNDRALGQIRQQQLVQFGHSHATVLQRLSLKSLAEATGAKYFCLKGEMEPILRQALETDAPTLLEIVIRDSAEMKVNAVKGLVRAEVRSKLNDSVLLWLRKRRTKFARKGSGNK
jgi:acetolactate synthase-1/2/3 large subunit